MPRQIALGFLHLRRLIPRPARQASRRVVTGGNQARSALTCSPN
jgi:hypothetical protein